MPLLPGDDHRQPHLDTHKISMTSDPIMNDILDRLDKMETRLDKFDQDHQALAEIQEVLGKMETGG